MTLIECFTDSHIDNIAACLRLQPDKVIMLGNGAEMKDVVKRYQTLLRQRGQPTEIVICDVRGMGIGDIGAVLEERIRLEKDCVIDLTGGDEAVIMAVGFVLAKLDSDTRRSVRVEKFDRGTGMVLDCLDVRRKLPCRSVALTVEELIALHGGTLHPDSYQLPAGCAPRDIAGLWNIVSEKPKDWNKVITYLNEFESRSDSKMQVFLPLDHLHGSISNFDQKEAVVWDFLDKLHRYGVVDNRSSRHILEYTYCSGLLRYCTLKAGNMLEVKTLLEGRSVLADGAPFFGDCRMSVNIDWDGVVYDFAERKPETRNEIDVVLMHGLTPLFISCKNGNIGDDELYKLHTVAQRFGGPHARKMLIATDLDRKSPAANRAFIQRAWDMDIFLVTDAGDLSPDEWRQVFQQAVQ